MMGQRRGPAVPIVVATLLIFLTTLAVTSVALILVSESFPSTAAVWVPPLSTIKTGSINPALALGSLAGQRDEDVLDHAIAAKSIDTALAVLLYSPSLGDQARCTGLLNVARTLSRQKDNDRALLALRTSYLVAVLSPAMPDYAKASTLDQIGQALAVLGKTDEAARAYDAAATIAVHSDRLEPTYRRLLLHALADDVSRLGRASQARDLRAASHDVPAFGQSSPYVFAALLPVLTDDQAADWPELGAAMAQRLELASALIMALDGTSPASAAVLRQSLEKALVAEDHLRTHLYSDGLAQSTNLMQRVALARGHAEWLSVKWRAARQGFGLALVPGWEQQEREIAGALRAAWEQYYLLLRDAVVSLPDQVDAAQGTVDVIQDQIKLGRLGIYPGAQEGELVRALNDATRTCVGLAGSHPVVVLKEERSTQVFTLILPSP